MPSDNAQSFLRNNKIAARASTATATAATKKRKQRTQEQLQQQQQETSILLKRPLADDDKEEEYANKFASIMLASGDLQRISACNLPSATSLLGSEPEPESRKPIFP